MEGTGNMILVSTEEGKSATYKLPVEIQNASSNSDGIDYFMSKLYYIYVKQNYMYIYIADFLLFIELSYIW